MPRFCPLKSSVVILEAITVRICDTASCRLIRCENGIPESTQFVSRDPIPVAAAAPARPGRRKLVKSAGVVVWRTTGAGRTADAAESSVADEEAEDAVLENESRRGVIDCPG